MKVASTDEDDWDEFTPPSAPSPLPDIAVMSRKNDGDSGGNIDGDVEDWESVGS